MSFVTEVYLIVIVLSDLKERIGKRTCMAVQVVRGSVHMGMIDEDGASSAILLKEHVPAMPGILGHQSHGKRSLGYDGKITLVYPA